MDTYAPQLYFIYAFSDSDPETQCIGDNALSLRVDYLSKCDFSPVSVKAGDAFTIRNDRVQGHVVLVAALDPSIVIKLTENGTDWMDAGEFNWATRVPFGTKPGLYVIRVYLIHVSDGTVCKSVAGTPPRVIDFTVPQGDSDGDGFRDTLEVSIGTDPNLACGGTGAWPPDINGSKVADSGDLQVISNAFNAKVGDLKYNRRYDLNADKVINSGDKQVIYNYFNKRCG